jgi:hypothetical protein
MVRVSKRETNFPPLGRFHLCGYCLAMQERSRKSRRAESLQRAGEPVDRRTSCRYALRAPVIFHWVNGVERHAIGVSRDLSSGGAYVRCELKADCPKLGTPLAIEVLLPSVGTEILRLKGDGRVVRTNRSHAACGFAVDSPLGAHVEATGTAETPNNRSALTTAPGKKKAKAS